VTETFASLIADFIDHVRIRNYSKDTLELYTWHLNRFKTWCLNRMIAHPDRITANVIKDYRDHLVRYRKADDTPLDHRTRSQRLRVLKQFFGWLYENGIIYVDPTHDLQVPKHRHRLPIQLLTEQEVNALLEQPDTTTMLGLRDRAIMETLYSSGIRRAEVIALTIPDLRLSTRTLFIRQGKGKKDRIVPIGDRACSWLVRYISDVRPSLVRLKSQPVLFLTVHGRPLTAKALEYRVRMYKKQAGITKKGGCHLFRHAMAVGMLENGADIRHIQTILGHANLQTTARYTQVAITGIKDVHRKTHPFEKK
jgi:integrase/recombinase XerD